MKLVVLLFMILGSLKCFSQTTNEFRIYYGLSDSSLLRSDSLDGAASFNNENSYEFGLKYILVLSNNLSIETGVNYLSSKVTITPTSSGIEIVTSQEDLKLISIPIYANYTFGKYFYINGGPLLDFQNGENTFDSQSGIGYGLGIGAKYSFKQILLYVNPNLKKHSVIRFEEVNYPQKLSQFGIQLGIGYQF